MEDKHLILSKDFNSSLFLKSCIITGFYEGIRAGINTTISLEKCYISDTRSNCIRVVNPKYL